MKSIHPLAYAALAAALLSIPGGVAAEEPAEWERDAPPAVFYVSPVGPDGVPTHAVFRIVDDLNGEPIPGATAQLVKGSDRPVTGLVPAVRTGIADEEGWVRTRCDELGWSPTWVGALWVYVEAAGRGGLAFETGRVNPEVRLSPARDVVVEVRDAFDRPVEGATIGVRSEATCGHNPDQRVAVTDRRGRAVLRGLATRDGDEDAHSWEAYVSGEGLGATYHKVEISLLPGHMQILRHAPTTPVEGVVLDEAGKPIAGAHVGSPALHRGPWTVTDSGGFFRLVGADPHDEIVVEHDYDEGEVAVRFTAPPAGVRRIVRLPLPGQKVAPEPEVDVELVLVDATTKEEIERERVPVVAVRDGDGETVVGTSIQHIELPSGSWTILVGGGVSRWALARAPVVVDAKEERSEPLTIEVAQNPYVPIVFEDDPKKVAVWLVTATEGREIDRWELEEGRVPVPRDVECAFRVQGSDRNTAWASPVVFVPIPAERGVPGAKPLRLHVPAPYVVHARLVGPEGKPVNGWLSRPDLWWRSDSPPAAEPTIEVDAEGSARLFVDPEDRSLMPREVTVAVPEGAAEGARIDLGEIRLQPRGDRRLTVLGRSGQPRGDARVRVLRDGAWCEVAPSEGDVFDPAFPALAAGDLVEVDAYWDPMTRPARPVRKRLEGDGPWTVTNDAPATAIVLDAADETGKPVEAVLVIDGKAYEGWPAGDDGARRPFAVAGLDPGSHRVAVSASGHLTRLYRVVLKAGERRVLAPRLTPVPAPKPEK